VVGRPAPNVLHTSGWAVTGGPVTIVGDEDMHPYSRPPLSKAYLSCAMTTQDLYIRPPETYDQQDVTVLLGTRATDIDRDARLVRTATGGHVPYDRLVLAAGGRPRVLAFPDATAAANVFVLRTLADVDRIADRFEPGARLLVIGAGYIGLEGAAVARGAGLDVTVLEALDRVLARVTCPIVSSFYERLHAEHGVDVRTNTVITRFEQGEDGQLTGVDLGGGDHIEVDFAVVGIGMTPNTELADAVGLAVDDGVVVDEFCRTADPRIFAIGDCTRHPDLLHGGMRRLESAPNATEQAMVAAAALVGEPRPYDAVPWFWSDQYHVKMQTIGLSAGLDEFVVRGTPEPGQSFAVFYLKDGELRAADVVDSPRDFHLAK
jgi:3-phenylpropionate/trans-cinnamate dioxygenase ferredoxin reductase component